MSVFGLISVLFLVTFDCASLLDPKSNYRITDCSSEDRCWGTMLGTYRYLRTVATEKCTLFNIIDVSSFGKIMVLIQTAVNNTDCSDCNINFLGNVLQVYRYGVEDVRVIKPFHLWGTIPLEENTCYRLWYEEQNIGGRKYKFVRV